MIIRYTPQSIPSANRRNELFKFDFSREDPAESVEDSYLETILDVLREKYNEKFFVADIISLVILLYFSFIFEYILSKSNGNEIQCFDHAHIVLWMYKLVTPPTGYEYLSVGFIRKISFHPEQCKASKQNYGNFHVGLLIKVVLKLAEQHEKAAFGFGYKLTLKTIFNNTILSWNAGTVDGKKHRNY